ncbi:hypothetical protein OG311_13475 [Streptomyces sp. NBC_01343]|uniref:hypothetical protein n=1 Tax=Streptomyces sp. NBC_01343 TaxID=2903832 RepID=UPI002E12A481|nr:hypothetical protein OG311_13475 [Streptomyces sp. NBC_01343]
MTHVPDPPNSAWPEPEIHVHVTPEKDADGGWDFSWIQPWTNTWTAALAFAPANLWASVIHDVHITQSLSGAWFMAGAGVTVSGIRFAQNRAWTRRTVLWIAVLGGFLSLPAFSTVVDAVTGGGR